MTIEQQRAIALAQARLRLQQQGGANENADLPVPGTPFNPEPASARAPVPALQRMWDGAPQAAAAAPSAIGAFNEGFVENIPVVGPAVQRAGEAGGALVSSAMTGDSFDESLAANREFKDERIEGFEPFYNTGAVAGAVGPLTALGATNVGSRALGMVGTLPQRVMAASGSGAAIAGADTAARGGDMGEVAQSAALGLAAGAIPLAERALGAGIRLFTGQKTSPAIRLLSNAADRDSIAPAAIPAALRSLGPDAMMADLGPNLQRQAGAVASLPGQGQTIVRDALVNRNLGTNSRIQGDVNDILGPSPTPSVVQGEIRAGQQALSPEYEAVFANSRAVDTSPLAETLEAWAVSERGKAQQVARDIRDMLNVAGENVLDPSPRTLLQTRQAIDGMLSSETNSNAIRVLSQARQEVDNMLVQAVPGIKDVDARFAELARQSEALQTGSRALDSGKTAMRPEELAQEMQVAGTIIGPTGVPFRLTQGARAEIDRIIGTTGNNLNALKTALKGDGSWNRERLVSMFGNEKADSLLNVLDREMAFNRTYNVVTGNSETAARAAAQEEVAPRQFGQGTVSMLDLIRKVPAGIANVGARMRSEGTNAQLANYLTAQPGEDTIRAMTTYRALNSQPSIVAPASIPMITVYGGGD